MKAHVKLLAPLALIALTAATGCSNKTKAERDSLMKQNQDLSTQLANEKAAREAAEARSNSASTQTPTPTDTTAPAAPTMDPVQGDMSAGTGDTSTGTSGVKLGKNKYGQDTIAISSDVLFDSGKATLKPASKAALTKVVGIIKKKYGGEMLRIEGYTDPHPVRASGWDDNWDLGAARARAVLLYLEQHGVSKKDMYIASFGDNELKSTKNLALDRRVEIVVVRNGK